MDMVLTLRVGSLGKPSNGYELMYLVSKPLYHIQTQTLDTWVRYIKLPIGYIRVTKSDGVIVGALSGVKMMNGIIPEHLM